MRLKRTVYTLDFADTELDGLTVKATGAPIGTLLDLIGMIDLAERLGASTTADAEAGPEALRAVGELLAGFAKVLRSWDLEDDDGTAVPATLEGLRTLEMRHAMLVISTWAGAASAVPAPLSSGSSGGQPPPELSIPMELGSPSLAS